MHRWVVKYSPLLAEALHRRNRPVWVSWRMDETSIKGTEQRDEHAAKRVLTKAIRRHGVPEKSTIDGSAAHAAAIKSYKAEHGPAIEIRKMKYLHNSVEQDHRAVKRVTRPMLGCTSCDAAQGTLAGIDLMHMIKKKQLRVEAGDESRAAAETF
jgi:putative transposase